MRKDGNKVERTWMGNKNNPVLSCGGRRGLWPHSSVITLVFFFSSWSLFENHQLYSHPKPHSPVHICIQLGVRRKILKLAFYLCIWTETVKRKRIFGAITQIRSISGVAPCHIPRANCPKVSLKLSFSKRWTGCFHPSVCFQNFQRAVALSLPDRWIHISVHLVLSKKMLKEETAGYKACLGRNHRLACS